MDKEAFRLTKAQSGIWYTEKMRPGTSISNISASLWFDGDVDFSILEKAVNLYIEKNPAVRTRIIEEGTEPLQYFSEYSYRRLPFCDFSGLDDLEILEWENDQASIPFSLIDTDIFHCTLIKAKSKGGIYVKMHHLISDAWTIITLGNEISSYYFNLLKGNAISNEENPSYLEYINREALYLNSEKYARDKEFWSGVFETLPEPLNLQVKKPEKYNAERMTMDFSERLVSRVNTFCNELKISTPSFYLTLIAVLLNKLTSKNDFVLGTLLLNRKNAREKATAGMFIGTLPVRVKVDEELDFLAFSKELSKQMMTLYRHGEYPYHDLISDLREKNKGLDNLYEVLFSYQNARVNKNDEDIKTNSEWHFNKYLNSPLSISFSDRDNLGSLTVDYDYVLEAFGREQIEEIHEALLLLTEEVIAAPGLKISEYEIMSETVKNMLLYRFNNTERKYDLNKTINQLFEEQVIRTPDQIALVFADSQLTYRELNERANQLARRLKNLGIGPDRTTGIFVRRSLEMIVAIMSILKAGGAYLPIDPDLPEERVDYMLKDSSTSVILTETSFVERFNSEKFDVVILTEDTNYTGDCSNLEPCALPDNLAYILYTSGSTGQPKGVMIEHRSVVNFIYSILESMDFASGKTILSLTTMSFDIFFLESILPLTNGLKVIISNEEQQKIPRLLSELIAENQVDILQITPSRLNILLSDEVFAVSLQGISEILVGGEALQKPIVDKLKKVTGARIYNMYGPTETTIWSTFKEIKSCEDINIGKPIANTTVYILDSKLVPLPVGSRGMLYIGGKGLARGYHNREGLTKEKFIKNPFKSEERMYCTGDMAKWLPNGELQYIGREDNQLKINGYRVELGEIDACLLSFGRIKEAASVIKDVSGDSQLYAYFVAETDILPTEIRKYMSSKLPFYMIPSHFARIDSMPLTPNGKIDRNKLKQYEANFVSEIEYVPPRNDIEKKLVKIWNEILGDIRIGINDNLLVAGADSLSIISAISKIFKEFKVEIPLMDIYKSPTIKEIGEAILFQLIDSFQENIMLQEQPFDISSIMPSERRENYPLSSAQKRIFILQQNDKSSKNYNIPWAFLIEGSVDVQKFEASVNRLIERHEVFRTGFGVEGGEPVQFIHEHADFKLTIGQADEENIDRIIWDFIKPFDLSKPPLIRLALLELSEEKYLFLFDIHHIISDGESIKIMLSELSLLYRGQYLPPLSIHYKDYCTWQQQQLKSGADKLHEDYWMSVYSDEIPLLNLPTDFERPSISGSDGDRVRFSLGTELTKQVLRLTVETGTTLYMVLLSAYYVLLYRYTGQEDIVVGSPIVGRTNEELKNTVGMFVNTLALRNYPREGMTYIDFLAQVKESTLKAIENQEYQFEELVSKLKLKRDPGRNPLFDTMFSLQNFDMGSIKVGELNLVPYEFEYKISKFDILLEAVRNKNDISLNMDYCVKLFKRETVERMARHFTNIISEITANPEIRLDLIKILSKGDADQLIEGYNRTTNAYPKGKTINGLFEEQVLRTPENIAVYFNGNTLTYKELNEKSNALARVLRSHQVGNDSIVGIMLHRGLDLPVAVMGVLKAGGAFVPIDPNYPQDRIRLMLDESRANTLVTQSDLAVDLQFEGNIINIDTFNIDSTDLSDITQVNGPSSLLYVIFTSGSTGKPKGVMLEHKNLVNLINYQYTNTNIDFTKKVLQFTTISFDVCYQEIFSTLLCGGQLCIVSDDLRKSVLDMLRFIEENRITTVFLPPSYLKLIISDESILNKLSGDIRHIIIAGEQLILTDIFIKYLRKHKVYLHNHYGPSETHVATAYTIDPQADIMKLPPIGKPISNTRVYITDKNGAFVPAGVAGELLISGDCVGRGYLNNPDLTRDKYFKDPNYPEDRVYRTGDLARWRWDGNLEFLGRADSQVKIRGFRIELGEIESLLLNYAPVKEAAVIPCADKQGNKFLFAYYESVSSLSNKELRTYLSAKLPDYMLPAGFMRLEKMPLTPNGKINRRALPEPVLGETQTDSYEPARNNIDSILIEVWSKVLNNNRIGIDHNFFELGGDSLLIIQMQVKLFQYKLGLTIQDFYKYQTIRQLSDYICGLEEAAAARPIIGEQYISLKAIRPAAAADRTSAKDGMLLTGATGYLGMHVLDDILSFTNLKAYCLVRGKNHKDAENRLYGLLNYYFPKKYSKYCDRIIVVNGDISSPQFGLSIKEYAQVGGNTGMIIHSAALVKHYGNYNEFEKINVTGVKEVLEFASSFGCFLNHISTIGVSGNNYLIKQDFNKEINFSEYDYYVGQKYSDNVYIRSKFEAEGMVFEAINSGTNAAIHRIGNLTGRHSDGVFQYNIKQNAFYSKIRSIIQLGVIPENLLDQNLEFSPVDYCSRGIVCLASDKSSIGKVFHVFNHNYIKMKEFIKMLSSLGYQIKIVDPGSFQNYIARISQDAEKQEYLAGIIEDFDSRTLSYTEFCKVSSDITQNCLGTYGFSWPSIDLEYLEKILGHMRNTGFIS